MLLFLETVNIVAIFIMVFMLVVILRQQSSKVQLAFVLYDMFTIFFVIGIHLELLRSDTVGEALSGLCVQYIGQVGLLMSLLWFVSEFVKIPISARVYQLEAICDIFVLVGIFTAEKHTFFYSSMRILTDGLYNRIEVGRGILWHLHFVHLYAVVLTVLILCMLKYKTSTPIQRKRIKYVAVGHGAILLLLALKIVGVFGSYNPIVIAMAFSMSCMMLAVVKYGYFGSLHAAVDNAFNHGSEGLIVLDDESMIVFVNRKMNELFPDIHKGNTIDSYEKIKKLIEGKEHFIHQNGKVYELRVEDIIEYGEKNGCMLWLIDQTQQILTMKKLKEADEAKTQFLMMVSHELRTPMNTILGMNEMIIRESKEEEIKDYANEVADAGEHMLLLIDEVLNASRLESGIPTIQKEPYQISKLFEKIEELMRQNAEKKGLTFTVEAESDLMEQDNFLVGDFAHLFQVLINLLSNAIKYTDSGFVNLKAEVVEDFEDKKLVFSVCDSGIGICEKELNIIFENFERGSNTSNREGIGLGLAIVKQLADAMKGKITVISELGKGSIFSIALLYERATEQQIAVWKEKKQKNAANALYGQEQESPDFHTKTILAVDDNERNLMVLKHLLKRTKVSIETAADGEEAVKVCMDKKYDLILLDHMMPKMNGITTLYEIKEGKKGKNQNTNVIALTANAGKGAEEMYLSKGFVGYIKKPIDPEQLEEMLVYYLGIEKTKQHIINEVIEEEWLKELEQYEIDSQKGLRYSDMDTEFYKELLLLFVKEREERQQQLENSYQNIMRRQDTSVLEQEIWDKWIACCHRLKGEARGLGAFELGECFYQLELAGGQKDKQKIEQIYMIANKKWQKVINGIQKTVKEPPL